MPRALKYSLIIFVSIIFLLIIIPFFIPLNSYKNVVISKVKEATNRDLIINGDIKLSLLPNLVVSLMDIKLLSIAGTKDPYLVFVNEAKATLKLLPLLKGAIEIANIELQKPVVNLEILNNGQKNWQFSTISNKASVNDTVTAPNNDKAFELPILINQFKIASGKLIYIEGGSEKIFEDINFDCNIKSLKGAIDFNLSINNAEQKISIDGNVAEIAKIIPLEVNINLAGEKIQINGKFDSENNSFIGNTNVKGNTKTLGVPSELQNDYELDVAIIADKKNIIVKDARLNYMNMELLANANYDIESNSLKSKTIINPGNIVADINSNFGKSAVFNGNIKMQVDNLTPLFSALKLKSDKLPPIANQKLMLTTNIIYKPQEITLQDIKFNAANSNIEGAVKIKNWDQDLTISPAIKINNFDSFMALLGVSDLNMIKTVQLNGEVQKSKDTYRINNKISILDTNILVKGNINIADQKPNFDLNLYSPLINFDKILVSKPTFPNKVSTNVSQNTPKTNSSPWSNNPINLAFLNNIEGQLSVNIDKLTNDSLIIKNLKSKITITAGKLDISLVTANIYGGDLAANGYLNANKDQNAYVKIDLKNAYLKNLTPQDGKIKVTDGRLSLKSDLNSLGNSIYTYINNLNGQFNLNSQNGKISGFDLNRIVDAVNNVKNAESILRLINNSFSGGETSFNNLVINGNIMHGIVKLVECNLEALPVKGNASGQINLPQYMMDINVSVNIADLSPPMGVKLYGSINNPQHKLDIKALQTYLVKNVFNSVVKDLKNGETKPENIIKDALGLRKKKTDTSEQQNNPEPSNENKPADPVNKLLQKGLKKLF